MTKKKAARPWGKTVRVEFDDGNRYSDFNPDIDTVAAYGIGGLIAGKLAAKAGIFALLAKGGKFIVLNHFKSANAFVAKAERAISPFTVHIGFKADLDLPGFLAQADLTPVSIRKVSFPRIWSLVTFHKD